MQYLFALHKWNAAYNLTAIRDVTEMVHKHLIDSLSVLPHLLKEEIRTLADVGSGAGLPGIPLAIANPTWSVTLVDSNSKKTGFLKHALLITGLTNIQIINARSESLVNPQDIVISRAFSSLRDMVELTQGLQGPSGSLWAMKGKFPDQELPELPKGYRVSASHSLCVPGIDGERHLLKIIKG